MPGPFEQTVGIPGEKTEVSEGVGEPHEDSALSTIEDLVKDLDSDAASGDELAGADGKSKTASGDDLAGADGKSKTASDDADSKTSYTPWIIGGVATAFVGVGVFMYVKNKKKAI